MSLGPYSTKYRTTDKLKLNAKNENSYIDVGDAYVKPIAKPSRSESRSAGMRVVARIRVFNCIEPLS